MTNKQPQQQYAIGMVGLDVMGRNLLLNIADHGFPVVAGDPNPFGSENTVGVTGTGR